jgi:hypothetical protein
MKVSVGLGNIGVESQNDCHDLPLKLLVLVARLLHQQEVTTTWPVMVEPHPFPHCWFFAFLAGKWL